MDLLILFLFLFFLTCKAYITSVLTIRHITFGLSIDPFQNVLTIQGYFGMAFEYATHGLGPLIDPFPALTFKIPSFRISNME